MIDNQGLHDRFGRFIKCWERIDVAKRDDFPTLFEKDHYMVARTSHGTVTSNARAKVTGANSNRNVFPSTHQTFTLLTEVRALALPLTGVNFRAGVRSFAALSLFEFPNFDNSSKLGQIVASPQWAQSGLWE